MARVAIPLAADFEDSEFKVPYDFLKNAGHAVTVVGTTAGETVEGKRGETEARIERSTRDINSQEFDMVVIPGGFSPDHLRLDPAAVVFVRDFGASGKPIAAICHGPQLLIEADLVRGKTLTSWPSVRKDLENAGAIWVDREVVEDGNLLTSRKPDDLSAFCAAIAKRIATRRAA